MFFSKTISSYAEGRNSKFNFVYEYIELCLRAKLEACFFLQNNFKLSLLVYDTNPIKSKPAFFLYVADELFVLRLIILKVNEWRHMSSTEKLNPSYALSKLILQNMHFELRHGHNSKLF